MVSLQTSGILRNGKAKQSRQRGVSFTRRRSAFERMWVDRFPEPTMIPVPLSETSYERPLATRNEAAFEYQAKVISTSGVGSGGVKHSDLVFYRLLGNSLSVM